MQHKVIYINDRYTNSQDECADTNAQMYYYVLRSVIQAVTDFSRWSAEHMHNRAETDTYFHDSLIW